MHVHKKMAKFSKTQCLTYGFTWSNICPCNCFSLSPQTELHGSSTAAASEGKHSTVLSRWLFLGDGSKQSPDTPAQTHPASPHLPQQQEVEPLMGGSNRNVMYLWGEDRRIPDLTQVLLLNIAKWFSNCRKKFVFPKLKVTWLLFIYYFTSQWFI